MPSLPSSRGGAARAAWIASVLVHGALVIAILAGERPARPAPPLLPVTLIFPAPARTWPDLQLPTPRARPADRAPRRLLRYHPRPVAPPPDGEATDPRWVEFEREVVHVWGEHSLVPWVDACRTGTCAPDSLLERPRTAKEVARAELTASLNREFVLRRGMWELERFLEEYRKNFPLMR